MKKFALPVFAVLGALLAVTSYAAPAHAQSRTWVSGVGDDVNPCSRTAPCKTFAGAISKTATAGEINCLDSGGFGAVTITKSISIVCEGVIGGVLAAGVNGVVVNVPDGSEVLLQGLDIDGFGTGLNGVRIIGGGKTTIRKSWIRNFSQNGVQLAGLANARVFLDESFVIGNAGGFNVQPAANVANAGLILNSLLDNQSSFSIQVTGVSSMILMGSQLIGTPAAIVTSGSPVVESYGNNVIRGTGNPTLTSALK